MTIKARMAILVILFSKLAFSFVPTSEWVIKEINKKCLNDQSKAVFNGVLNDQKQSFFFKLELLKKELNFKEISALSGDLVNLGRSLDLSLFKSFIFCELSSLLSSLGIDSTKISLAVLDNEPVYILGALAHEAHLPQIWVDKERYELLLIKHADYQQKFSHYRLSKSLKQRFPEKIDIRHGADLESYFLAEDS